MLRSKGKRRKKQRKTRRAEKTQISFSLGEFTNFPSLTHGLASISHGNNMGKIQRIIIQALYNLNGHKDSYPVSVAGHAGAYEGELAFEVGVANGLFFDYLSEEILKELYSPLESGKEYSILDFLVIVTYHYSREKKRIPLIFDHHILRFSFNDGEVEVTLFHSKGTRRMPLDEFLNVIISRIKFEAKSAGLRPINVERLRTL